MPGMIYETSKLDSNLGITYREHSLEEIVVKAPKAKGGSEPLPEGVLWLLLTGEYPTEAETKELVEDLQKRSHLPSDVVSLLTTLPKEMHSMTQLSVGVLALQHYSLFAKAYREGTKKAKYWETTLEDSLNLIAKIPKIAAIVYRHTFKDNVIPKSDNSLELAANYAQMMGFNDEKVFELMRLYLTIHADHEGGNVSAHASHLVGSALSDPYLSYSAALNGLAGPLHGLANQEVLRWLLEFIEEYGNNYTDENIHQFVASTLKGGRVIPGYGHAVLRKTDPRFIMQQKFAEKHIKGDPLVKALADCYRIIPGILEKGGKVKNPYPNVDAHSGALLRYYGITEFDYYTVLFGVSRAIGTMSALVWSRALGFPIERPNSFTLLDLKNKFEGKKEE